jgi:hypothetical protein
VQPHRPKKHKMGCRASFPWTKVSPLGSSFSTRNVVECVPEESKAGPWTMTIEYSSFVTSADFPLLLDTL